MTRIVHIFIVSAIAIMLSACAEEGADSEAQSLTPTTWNSLVGVFSSNGCYGCHPATGTSLDYASLINGSRTCPSNRGALDEIGTKELSCLWLSVTDQEGSDMGGAVPFSSSATVAIGRWIDEGAPGP